MPLLLTATYCKQFVFHEVVNFCCSKQTAILKLHFVESLLQINPGLFVLFVEFRKSVHFETLGKNTCDRNRGNM